MRRGWWIQPPAIILLVALLATEAFLSCSPWGFHSSSSSSISAPSRCTVFQASNHPLVHYYKDTIYRSPVPLLITIGPQCSGKTALLRRLNTTAVALGDPPLYDVAIDNDPRAYRKVGLEQFLQGDKLDLSTRMTHGPGQGVSSSADEECRLVLNFLLNTMPDKDVRCAIEQMLAMVRKEE